MVEPSRCGWRLQMDQELALKERMSGSGTSPGPSIQSNVWVETGRLNVARAGHTATLLQNGTVLVHGGEGPTGADGQSGAPLSSAELFNPGTRTWTLAPSAFYERLGHTATLLRNGKVLVVG